MGATKLASVINTVLADAKAAATRRVTEVAAIKTAAAAPRTELAIGLRALAEQIRSTDDDITYGDLS